MHFTCFALLSRLHNQQYYTYTFVAFYHYTKYKGHSLEIPPPLLPKSSMRQWFPRHNRSVNGNELHLNARVCDN